MHTNLCIRHRIWRLVRFPMVPTIGVTGPAGFMVAIMAGGGSGGGSFSSFEGLRASKSV